MSEKEVGFKSLESSQSEWKSQLKKIEDAIPDGKDDKLAHNYHFFATTYDRKTKQYSYLTWQPSQSMKKGV